MSDRPYDWGSQYPADSTDTAPIDPTSGITEVQYAVKRHGNPQRFHAAPPFDPNLHIPQKAKPIHRDTCCGIILSETTTANDNPRMYLVALSDGRQLTCTCLSQRPDENYAVGQPVVVTAGDSQGTSFILGRPYFNELNALTVTNGSQQKDLSGATTVVLDTVSQQTGSNNAETSQPGLSVGSDGVIHVGTSGVYQISFDVELEPPTRLFEATLNANISSAVTTVGVLPVTAIWGNLPTGDDDGNVTANNDLLFTASEGQTVVVAKDDYDGTYRIVAVKSSDAILFEAPLNSTLMSSDAVGSFTGPTVPIWGTPPDTSGSPLAFSNDFGLAGQTGQTLLIAQGSDNVCRLIQTKGGANILFYGSLYTGLTSGTTTVEVTPLTALFGALPGSLSSPQITANNNRKLTAPSGSLVLVAGDSSGNYYVLLVPTQVMFWGTLQFPITSSTASATVYPVTQVYGPLPTAPTITASNQGGFSGPSAQPVLIVQAEGTATYYVASCASSNPVSMFEATIAEPLESSTESLTVTPTELIWGDLPGEPVSATNDFFLVAESGATVLVVTDTVGDYHIIQTPPPYGGCTFQLTSTFSSEEDAAFASATVGYVWGYAPNAEGDSITVVDPEEFFGRALNGATGEAVYDPATENYIVTLCDQETLRYRGTLSGQISSAKPVIAVDNPIGMNSFPYGQVTVATTMLVANVLGLGGPSGAVCYVDWCQGGNGGEGQWELTMVAPVQQQVLCREQLTAPCTLQYTSRNILGWFNDNAESALTTVANWSSSNLTMVEDVHYYAGARLAQQTQSFYAIGPVGNLSGYNTIFNTASVSPYTTLTGVSGTSPYLGGSTTTFDAISPAPEASAPNWYTPTTYNYVESVALSGAGTLTYVVRPVFAFGQLPANSPSTSGNLTTTTYSVMTSLNYATNALTASSATLTVLGVSDIDTGDNIFSTTSLAPVTSLSYTSSTLTAQTTSFDAINAGTQATASWSPWCNFTTQQVVTTVTWDGTNLKQALYNVNVLSASATSTPTIDTPTVCS